MVLDSPIAYLKVQIITRETDKHLFTKKWLKPKQSCGRWLAHFRGSTMCDFNLESSAWDWMCDDMYKAARGRDSDKITLSLTSLVVGNVCGIQKNISNHSRLQSFLVPPGRALQTLGRFLIHLFMVVTGISYFCHTCGQ